MNLDIQEEKVRISIEVREYQIRLQNNKDTERQLIEELIKRKGQLELLESLEAIETTDDIKEQKINESDQNDRDDNEHTSTN